jgi:hypothetical protein
LAIAAILAATSPPPPPQERPPHTFDGPSGGQGDFVSHNGRHDENAVFHDLSRIDEYGKLRPSIGSGGIRTDIYERGHEECKR